MSLIDAMMESFVMMNKVNQPDGEGGFVTTWSDGASFKAVATLDSSLTARIAEKDGFQNVYTVTTKKNVTLEYHDVIKRERDGKIFRITSDGADKVTPNDASLDMRQVTAELWRLS